MLPRKKSILFVINSFARGGAERVFLTDVQLLEREGFEVSIATLYTRGVLAQGVTLTQGQFYELQCRSLFSAVRKIRALLLQRKFDIVVSTLNEANMVSRIACLFVPATLFTREANMINAKGVRYKIADILFGFRSNYILAVSRAVGKSATTYTPWLSSKVRVLYNGVPLPGTLHRRRGPGTRLLTVGSLTPKKDQGILIDAMSFLPDSVTLTIIGEGSEQTALEIRVRERSLTPRVFFMGACSHEEVMMQYDQHDVFVLPSKYEGCPNVLSEAQSKGLPCVAFAIAGIEEFISKESGIIVPVRSVEALSHALTTLITNSDVRLQMGNSGFLEVGHSRSIRSHTEQLLKLLCEA